MYMYIKCCCNYIVFIFALLITLITHYVNYMYTAHTKIQNNICLAPSYGIHVQCTLEKDFLKFAFLLHFSNLRDWNKITVCILKCRTVYVNWFKHQIIFKQIIMYTHNYSFNDSFAVASIFCSTSKVLSLLLFDNLKIIWPISGICRTIPT